MSCINLSLQFETINLYIEKFLQNLEDCILSNNPRTFSTSNIPPLCEIHSISSKVPKNFSISLVNKLMKKVINLFTKEK